jgi:hypothetical protein
MYANRCWLIILLGLAVVSVMASCQSPGAVDELARAELATVQADLDRVSAQITEHEENVQVIATTQASTVAMQATVAALTTTTTADTEDSIENRQNDSFKMALKLGIEVIHQDNDNDALQSIFFPLDRLAFYPSLDDFGMDWLNNADVNRQSQLLLVFLSDPSMGDAWQLYYTTDMITDTVTWESPAWRTHIVSVDWQPVSQAVAGTVEVPATMMVMQGEKEMINSHAIFLPGSTIMDSLSNLANNNNLNLTSIDPVMFLIHDGSNGHDDFLLVLVEEGIAGPHPHHDSPSRQYCSRCRGFRCQFRCWRY